MSQENVEIVSEVFEPFARGDFGWFAELADDFEFVTSPELPDAGTYRGAAAARWMLEWVDSFDGHTIEVTETIDAGDKAFVATIQRGHPHGSKTEVERSWWLAMTLRDGIIVRAEIFSGRDQALEAAGLAGA